MKIITVGGWDCCAYTHSIWVNENLGPKDKVDLGSFADDTRPDNLIRELRKAGFRQALPQQITFGENF
jgi:hypothetical protein